MSDTTANKDSIYSIILLTDFSDYAKNAIRYAVDAFGTEAEYNLVNAYYARTSSATLLDLNDMLAKESEEGLTDERKWIEETYPNSNIKTHSIFGSPIDVIKRLKQEKRRDLVVMGTKGASGVDAVLFGSVASAVIRATVIPVISVPPDCKFNGFNQIVFATDGDTTYTDNILAPVQKISKQFGSNIHVFSVDKEGEHVDFAKMNLDFENAHYASVESDDVVGAVSDYCNEKQADILVVLPKHTGFFERFFHKSISKELVEQAKLPILSLEND